MDERGHVTPLDFHKIAQQLARVGYQVSKAFVQHRRKNAKRNKRKAGAAPARVPKPAKAPRPTTTTRVTAKNKDSRCNACGTVALFDKHGARGENVTAVDCVCDARARLSDPERCPYESRTLDARLCFEEDVGKLTGHDTPVALLNKAVLAYKQAMTETVQRHEARLLEKAASCSKDACSRYVHVPAPWGRDAH
jgi:hypothetical protein